MPTERLPKERLEGETPANEVVPVPERLTVCGLPVALSAILTIAARSPDVVGLKVTLIVQLEPAPKLDPQLLLWTKSLALAPEAAMLVTFNDALPELVRVTV